MEFRVILFVLIYSYLMALRVFKSFSLLSYGFLFNIKGLSVKYFRFFLQFPVMPIRGEPNRTSQIVLRNLPLYQPKTGSL